jgi:RNA polymerase sigma-70 factor (ECF subfamily)
MSAIRERADQASRGAVHQKSSVEPDEIHEAAAALLARLSPQEQVCVVLKDVFDMSLEETATVVGTTVGAVKAALHRGRGRLREQQSTGQVRRPAASPELVERFVDRYNARDLPGLLALMLDTASIDLLGLDLEIGRPAFEREHGWFHHNLNGPPGWPTDQPFPARWQRAEFGGEPIALVFNPDFDGGEVLGSVMRFEELDARVAAIRAYAMCPETVREVGQTLGHAVFADPYAFVTLILSFARGH